MLRNIKCLNLDMDIQRSSKVSKGSKRSNSQRKEAKDVPSQSTSSRFNLDFMPPNVKRKPTEAVNSNFVENSSDEENDRGGSPLDVEQGPSNKKNKPSFTPPFSRKEELEVGKSSLLDNLNITPPQGDGDFSDEETSPNITPPVDESVSSAPVDQTADGDDAITEESEPEEGEGGGEKCQTVNQVTFDWYHLISRIKKFMQDEEVGVRGVNYIQCFDSLHAQNLVKFKNTKHSRNVVYR